jgi:hypothetical protein
LDPTEVQLERGIPPSSQTPLHTSCTISSQNPNNRLSNTTEAMTSSRSTNNLRNVENSVSRSPVSKTPPISNNSILFYLDKNLCFKIIVESNHFKKYKRKYKNQNFKIKNTKIRILK